MADYLLLTERQQRLYDSIAAAARAGEVCPTNKAIAAASGLVSASAVADALGRLQRKGKVRVERFNRARVVHLPDLGLATATPPVASPRGLAPHWRERLPGVPLPEPAARAAVAGTRRATGASRHITVPSDRNSKPSLPVCSRARTRVGISPSKARRAAVSKGR